MFKIPENRCVFLFSCVSALTVFEMDSLNSHNKYRAKHGVPPLKWNPQLAADAQKWANHLASISEYYFLKLLKECQYDDKSVAYILTGCRFIEELVYFHAFSHTVPIRAPG